jgi:hypothetical protein
MHTEHPIDIRQKLWNELVAAQRHTRATRKGQYDYRYLEPEEVLIPYLTTQDAALSFMTIIRRIYTPAEWMLTKTLHARLSCDLPTELSVYQKWLDQMSDKSNRARVVLHYE